MIVVLVMKEEGAGDAVRVPRRKQRRSDADEVIEDGHADGEDESGSVHDEDEHDPRRPSQERVRVQVFAAAEDAHEDEFCCRVAVEAARDQEVRDRDAIRCFGPLDAQARERRAQHAVAQIHVAHYREDGVERGCEGLQRVCRFHGVGRLAHL